MSDIMKLLCVMVISGFAYAEGPLGGSEAIKPNGPLTTPSWQKLSPAELNIRMPPATPSTPGTAPAIPGPPPYTPCSSTSSCAPGVGFESGGLTKPKEQVHTIDKNL